MRIDSFKLYFEDYVLDCKAPCSLYSVLLDHKKIPDPFYGLNERELTPLSDKDCRFESVFSVDESTLAREFVELRFFGLDTICDIFLNGKRISSVKNMHRSYIFEVKPLLKLGENILVLEFKSPTKYFSHHQARHPLFSNNGYTLDGAPHLRKALYMSGWDWGPTLPDMGIFRSIELVGYDLDKIDTVLVRQYHDSGKVTVEVCANTAHCKGDLAVEFDGERYAFTDGKAVFEVKNPRLWWVRGYGDQPLYDLTVLLLNGSEVIDRQERKIGLRTLTVSTQKDGDGNEFCFVINGVKIFSMGANYIPIDNILSRVKSNEWQNLIKWAADANFNTIRVWGGGYYPDDEFYDLCDQNGILVWEDFMVACANIWLTADMKCEFENEVRDNLIRLNTHPSLGMLCGNNEMEMGVMCWGAKDNLLVQTDYINLYEHLIPELCEKLAPDVFYWPSSPSSGGGFDDFNNPDRGDTHYWDVWHGGKPFTDYREKHFRFCSEYGYESFPAYKTVKSFCKEKDMKPFSEVMLHHQKCVGGNEKIMGYFEEYYPKTEDFEKIVYGSQLMQAQAIKYGVEHFRRERGYCMGSTYWQFNDCWPVASWSSVDYFGRYKALHYAAKRFYAPVAMGLFLKDRELIINVSNETMSDFEGEVIVAVCDNKAQKSFEKKSAVFVKNLSTNDVLTLILPEINPNKEFVSAVLLNKNGEEVARNTELLTKPRDFEFLSPCFEVNCNDIDGGVEIKIKSNVFAKDVYLDFEDFDCIFSDNFFDLFNGEERSVVIRTDKSAQEVKNSLIIMSAFDIVFG